MKTFVSLALTLVLTAACLVGCGCTNQNMDTTSAPTVLPTNEEIWNSTEATTHFTTEATTAATDATESTGSVNETEVQNHVNAHTEMMDKIRENENAGNSAESNGNSRASRMMPGTR